MFVKMSNNFLTRKLRQEGSPSSDTTDFNSSTDSNNSETHASYGSDSSLELKDNPGILECSPKQNKMSNGLMRTPRQEDSRSPSPDIIDFSSSIDSNNIKVQASTSSDSSLELKDNNPGILECSYEQNEMRKESKSPTPDIIDLSSDDEESKILPKSPENNPIPQSLKQTTLKSFEERKVSLNEYNKQLDRVNTLEAEYNKIKSAIETINPNSLPDKGFLLKKKHNELEKMLESSKNVLQSMVPPPEQKTSGPSMYKNSPNWESVKAEIGAVQPRTFGKQAMATYNAQKALTVETLEEIHNSLKTRPNIDDLEKDPKALKVELMKHQKYALGWLMWRETQKPCGGILADDMGLGKTLTMISLILKSNELKENINQEEVEEKSKYKGGTLVVCPASLINQWQGEVKNRCKRGSLSVELYHGPRRETQPKVLAKYDMVVTTYTIVLNEIEKNGPIFRVKWNRIILDEAHQIRNHKSQTSVAICELKGKCRWALTGTPIHNKEIDMYALLKFLRCSPFDDLQVWKRWVSDKSSGGQGRLHTVISSLMLRRTKEELMIDTNSFKLPKKTWELVAIELKSDEMAVYQKVLLFSKTLFAQFLYQRAEKNQDNFNRKNILPNNPNGEYFKMRQRLLKLNRVKDISQHEILVLLLRLRQLCCHPHLIKGMVQQDGADGDDALSDEDEEYEELNLWEQMKKLDIKDNEENVEGATSAPVVEGINDEEKVNLKEASKGYLNPSNPVFSPEFKSSKIQKALALVRDILQKGEKVVVVSQFKSMLNLLGIHLKNERLIYQQLDGTVPVNKRMPLIESFNDPNSDTNILLLSLTAGGVGLNLVGGNHLILLDLHWNPQLETQAQDRIYRMGQKKPVFVYKFMASDTIEQNINILQEKKLQLAREVLTGSKEVLSTHLSLQDLKMLFDM